MTNQTSSLLKKVTDRQINFLEHAFAAGDLIELRGNLGARVYDVKQGTAHFHLKQQPKMTFGFGQFFGQMELSRNYFASRLLGNIYSSDETKVQTFKLMELSAAIRSDDFGHQLFLSMLEHWDGGNYTPYLAGDPLSDSRGPKSRVIEGVSATGTQTCAAVLLGVCAKQVRLSEYKSRLVIRLTYEDFESAVYLRSRNRKRETQWQLALRALVLSGAIDCFSPFILRNPGLHRSLSGIEEHSLRGGDFLNLGHIASSEIAIWLEASVVGCNVEMEPMIRDICQLLGFEKRTIGELGDERAQGRKGGTRTATDRPPTISHQIEEVIANIETQIESTLMSTARRKLSHFLEELRDGFNVREKTFYGNKGLSEYVVVRDVWALLGCVLDDKTMWFTRFDNNKQLEEAVDASQTERLIAYFSECISFVARNTLHYHQKSI